MAEKKDGWTCSQPIGKKGALHLPDAQKSQVSLGLRQDTGARAYIPNQGCNLILVQIKK